MSALLSAFGSIESTPVPLSLRATFSSLDLLSDFRFSVTGGGVIERGGVATGGAFKDFEAFLMCACEMAELVISLLGTMMAIWCRKRGWLSEYCPCLQIALEAPITVCELLEALYYSSVSSPMQSQTCAMQCF